MRPLALSIAVLLSPLAIYGVTPPPSAPPAAPALSGVVSDPSGAIVPNAEIDLVETNGAVAGSFHSAEDGSFKVVPPHPGDFTLVVSEPGLETIKRAVTIATNTAAKIGRAHV